MLETVGTILFDTTLQTEGNVPPTGIALLAIAICKTAVVLSPLLPETSLQFYTFACTAVGTGKAEWVLGERVGEAFVPIESLEV